MRTRRITLTSLSAVEAANEEGRIMGEATTREGISRRDLIKRSAVAGAIVWTAPILESSAAWGQTPEDCNECDGLTLYSKYAPGNANATGNQCLAPCAPVTVISDGFDTDCGFFSVTDGVQTDDKQADVTFSNQVRLIRTSIHGTDSCYVTTCEDDFNEVRVYGQSTNPPCDDENITGTPYAGTTEPPLFEFYVGAPAVLCGAAPNEGGCEQEVRRVRYDTNGLPGNVPLNFIEIVVCLKGTSVLPPGCG